ncbi:unnamed protein product [Calypogeia fissa]
MEAFSDDEFYEARDEISSTSGSDESLDEDFAPAAEISGRQEEPQRSARGPLGGRSSKPPRHNQPPPPEWLTESRFSVWQDGPKSIQERRRLLYERFGIFGRKDGRSEGLDNANASPDGAQIRVTRFGIREHLFPARKEVGRTWNSSAADIAPSDLPFSKKSNGSTSDRDINAGGAAGHSGSSDESNRLHYGESSKSGLKDFDPVTLGRSPSDSSALMVDFGDLEMGGARERSVNESPQFVPGIERLTQTSGAVLREGVMKGPSSSKPPTGSRSLSASKSAPSDLHNLVAKDFEKVSKNVTQSLAVDRRGAHPNTPIGPSTASSPIHVLAMSSREVQYPDGSVVASQAWALADGSILEPSNGQLSSNSLGEFVDAIQDIVGTTAIEFSDQYPSPSYDENSNDVALKIKDLDSGKEFIIKERGTGGDTKLRELDTGKELTLEEFESTLGLSPVMQEVRRRERQQNSLDDDDAAQGAQDSTASSKKKKKSLWVRTMKGVAKTVGGSSKSKSQQDLAKGQNEGSRGESGGEDREGSVGRDTRRENSFEKSSCKARSKRVSDDPPQSLRPRSPQRVKVQVYKKNFKDLSDLHMGQEIQAHQGAIWTMKFSLDGRYLASAGQDRVVHVREVLEHPFAKDQGARDGLEASAGKVDTAGAATPEHSQHSQEGSQGRRASLRGSVGKKSSAKKSSSAKLPKLFWLSEIAICSFKGHTEDVLDLSWSRTEFLLSSSMDKTVRLWHMSYSECLRVFTHNDFVTTIEFSPTDDRYFLSGSLDDKVRLWSIPDHQVVDWSDVREMVTAASYSPDGKRAVIGTYKGTCRFYNTAGQKLQLEGQIDVKSAQAKKSRGKKITGLQFVPGDSNKVLITSNDSRVRVYDGPELNLKFKGLRNLNSQISATFNRSGEYIISASEDSRIYLWNFGIQEFKGNRKDKPQSYEFFPSSNVSVAASWPGMDPQPVVGAAKEDQNEMDTSSSRQSTNDGPLRSPLRCSPRSSSSSRSNGSTHSESGLTSESVGECKSEQSVSFLLRNGLGRDVGDEEVTSKRIDANGSFQGQYDNVGRFHSTFKESSLREDGTRPEVSSPALSVSNDSPPLGLSSLRSPSPSFFPDVTTPKSSATWPEEKLPPLQDSVRSQGGSWSASSPSQDILSTELSPEGSTEGNATAVASWGLVIVTASLTGEIRTFQNYGYPIRL